MVLTEALGLWHGSALADVPPSALVSAEARRLEEARLTARELRAEADLGCGLHAQLVPELRRLVADQPLREELWGLLIRALDGAGRHAEAVAAYGQAAGLLARALSIHREAGDKYGEAQDLQQIGLAHARAGKAQEARTAWLRARDIFDTLGDQKQLQELRCHLAELGAESAQA
jgi:DNA-binding SARP family transcriptional activator